MSYRNFMQSFSPLVYVDFTDDPGVNLGVLDAQPWNDYTHSYVETVHNFPDVPTDSKAAVSFDNPKNATVPLPANYRSRDFTFGIWVQSIRSSDTVCAVYAGQTPLTNPRVMFQMNSAGTRRVTYSGTGSLSTFNMLTPTDPMVGLNHHVVRRTMNPANNGTGRLEFFMNGVLYNTLGFNTQAGVLGKDLTPDLFTATAGLFGTTPIAEAFFVDRTLSDQEIRSMSVDYVPPPFQPWRVVENGTEQIVTLDGVTASSGGVQAVVQVSSPTVLDPAPATYWDYEPLHAVVDAEGSIGGSSEGTEFLSAYSFSKVGNYADPATVIPGYTTDGVTAHSPEYKNGLKTFFKEMSKYPPEFVSLLNIDYPSMVVNLSGPTAGRDYGGLAQGNRFWFDIMGWPTYTNTYWGIGGNNGLELIIHHELQHMMRYTFAAEYDDMQTEWNALNSLPYVGADYAALDPNVRPQGHFRMYGRHSFDEDVADTLGFMMSTPLQPAYEQIINEDPAVAAKVQMLKDWLASQDDAFAHPRYFQAIHEGGT